MTSPLSNAIEVFSAPIEGVIVALGKGIGEAQAELDRASLANQAALDADPTLSGLGLQATWYQIPRVDLQLKLALAVVSDGDTSGPGPTVPRPPVTLPTRGLRLIAQPVSAAFQNHFDYNAQASSTVDLTIMPVPPPRAGDASTAPPRLAPAEVQAAALASPAEFRTVVRDQQAVPDPQQRFDVNFNAASRTWFVLQHDPATPDAQPVVVSVDDVTGTVRVLPS
jgi:hypothetical protein